MQRFVAPLLTAIAIAGIANGQTTDRGATLAQRLGYVRQAYATDSGAGAAVPASAQKSTEPTESKSRLPRIDPRALLPKQWFGASGEKPAASSKAEGTASARLQRDLRRGVVIGNDGDIAAAVGGPQSGRVGSTLSPGSKPPSKSPAPAAVARAIAQDVAASMANDSARVAAVPVSKPAPQTDPVDLAPTTDTPSAAPIVASSPPTAETNKQLAEVETPAATGRLPFTIGEEAPAVDESATQSARVVTQEVGRPSSPKASASDDQILVSQRMPVIVSRVSGPRTIVVGREATYRVTIANRGDAIANRLVARVTAPDWAEIVSAQPSSGSLDGQLRDAGSGRGVEWRMDRLAETETATLDLRLIAKAGRPIELGVSWEHAPVDAMAVVEVQEPKLAIHLAGPDEVLYGKSQLFRLTVSNPGTGAAENVRLKLVPPGVGHNAAEHRLGAIDAGESRSVEIELTAREAGALAVEAAVRAEGGLNADVTKSIFCRKAELALDWRGPDHRYAGAPATYYFRVRNPGTAVAQRVQLEVDLPAGFEVAPTADTPEAVGGRLTYRVGTLRPGDDRYFELRGVMRSAGSNTLTLNAAAEDETRAETLSAVTEVVALADLKLEVQDPRGPVPTGEEVAFKIRVTNRGASEAHDVSVVGLFSEGIEPGRAEGNSSQIDINDGRVAFGSIESIPAGVTREFTIFARAHAEGTHLFRTEVTCRDLEIKLAAEETTRFFEDEPIDIADSDARYRYSR